MKQNKLELQLKFQKFFVEQFWQLALVVAFISFYAWLFDKPIEAVLFCISHFIIRALFDKQFHCGTTAMCLTLTLSIGFFGIASCLPLSVSLLSTIPICFGIAAIGYIAQDRVDALKEAKRLRNNVAELQNQLSEILSKSKDPKEELLERCRNAELSDRDTKFAIMYYYERKTPKQIWLWYCQQKEYEPVEWSTIHQTLWRIGKKLNNK